MGTCLLTAGHSKTPGPLPKTQGNSAAAVRKPNGVQFASDSAGTDDSVFLRLLVKASESRRILQIGSYKRSDTLQLAKGAAAAKGEITAVGFSQWRRKQLIHRLQAADLVGCVHFSNGHLANTLLRLKGPFDFVFFDLPSDLYLHCLKVVEPLLASGALIVSGNLRYLGSKCRWARAYRCELDRLGLKSVRLQIGEGFAVSIKP